MDEHPTSALQYGHLGTATYQPGTQSWTFSRNLTKPPAISYSGITKTSLPSPLRASKTSLQDNRGSVSKVYPEAAASWSLIQDERLSRIVSTATQIYEPRVSSLFDLGNAADVDNDSFLRAYPIAVVATGESGDRISFRKIEEETLDLKQEDSARVRVPSVGAAETTEWLGCGAPVQQICFARTIESKPTWMAARFPQSTIIFRPLYHRDPVAMHVDYSSDYTLPAHTRNSRLDANQLVEIPVSLTGGFAHVDVTFNPWYQKQTGVVDERGNWSIWEIIGQQRQMKGNWAADCVRSGSLPWLDFGNSTDFHDHVHHDGWARIEWVGDFNCFIVSDRRCAIFYQMDGDRISSYSIDLGFERKSEWVLDLKRSPCKESHVFILTTSRVFWFDIVPSVVPTGVKDRMPSLYPRLSWRHFRDSEDTTLQLSPLLVGEYFYLILYSRLNCLAQVFQFPDTHEDAFFVSDPFLLDIPSMQEGSESHVSRHNSQFTTLVFKEIAHSLVSRRYLGQAHRPIKLFILDTRLSLHESLYFGPGSDEYDEERPLGREVLKLKKRFATGNTNRKTRYHNDFVVDDWDESVSGTDLPLASPSIWMPGSATSLDFPWTMDYKPTYQVAAGELAVVSKSAYMEHQPETNFGELLCELENRISNRMSNALSMCQTMLELLGSRPILNDIDQNARDLECFTSANMHPGLFAQNMSPLAILPLRLPSIPSVGPADWSGTSSKLDLIATYDNLVNDWLSSLPRDIPARTRVTKERVIRNLTAELLLGRISFIPRMAGTPDEACTTSQLDYEDHRKVPNSLGSAHDQAHAFTESVTEAPSILSLDTGIRRASHFAEQAVNTAPAEAGTSSLERPSDQKGPLCATLSMLTTHSNKRTLSENTTTILSHWQPGTNPDTYDWRKLTQEREVDEPRSAARDATPKRRSRKNVSQGPGLGVSLSSAAPAPAIGEWGGQPQNEPPRVLLPSSQPAEDYLPMTQIERGIFGGREAGRKGGVKARKKKRAAGF